MKPALLVIDVQKQFFNNPTTTQSLNQAIYTSTWQLRFFARSNCLLYLSNMWTSRMT